MIMSNVRYCILDNYVPNCRDVMLAVSLERQSDVANRDVTQTFTLSVHVDGTVSSSNQRRYSVVFIGHL